MLQYKTRGDRSPQGLQKVYFTCHPEDFAQYFDSVSGMILKEQNCAVVYDPEQAEYEDMETDLGRMQLFVIPVTTRLLTKKNRTIDTDLPFAISKHIPVLPLMMEEGLEELYARRFGDLHFLAPDKRDDTAITFEEKFKKYLGSVLVGDEMAEKVRKAFDAYIFLSYRKKDRAFAQKLMRLIHKNDFCRDIAIWYDEFLTPGEDFNAAIGAAMEKSKLFALVVTPHLLEKNDQGKPNYVMSTEYPEARKRGKAVLPAEMDPTDGEKLAEGFEGLDSTVNGDDEAELAAALHDALAEYAKAENDEDPEHNFFIGLAYLGGIDVETDHQRALELIAFAAEHDLPEAIEKLVAMYENGDGVERDYHKAIEWQRKLVDVYEKRTEEETNYVNCLVLVEAVWGLGNRQLAICDYDGAEASYKQMFNLCNRYMQVLDQPPSRSYYRYLAVSLSAIGDTFRERGNMKEAEAFYERALKASVLLSEGSPLVSSQRDLSISLERMGDARFTSRDLKKAEEYYSRMIEIRERIAEEHWTLESRHALSVGYEKLGDVYMEAGKAAMAEEKYAQALEICDQLAKETNSVLFRSSLGRCLSKLGNIRLFRGNLEGAEECCIRAVDISDEIDNEINTDQSEYEYAMCLFCLGDVCLEQGKYEESEYYIQEVLEIYTKYAKKTNSTEAQRNVALCYEKLGDIYYHLDRPKEAHTNFRFALMIHLRLTNIVGTPQSYDDLAIMYMKCSSVCESGSYDLLQVAYSICSWLVANCPDVPRYANLRDRIARMLS